MAANLAGKNATFDLFAAKIEAQRVLTVDHGMALGPIDILKVEPSVCSALLTTPTLVQRADTQVPLLGKTMDAITPATEIDAMAARPLAAMDWSGSAASVATFSTAGSPKFAKVLSGSGAVVVTSTAADGPKLLVAPVEQSLVTGPSMSPPPSGDKFATAEPPPVGVRLVQSAVNDAGLHLFAQSPDKMAGPAGSESVLYATALGLEGGWVNLGGASSAVIHHRVGQIMATERVMAIDSLPFGGESGPGTAASVGRVWLNVPGDPKGKPEGLSQNIPQTSVGSVAPSEGGFVVLPTYGAGEARNWITGWAAAVRVSQDPKLGQAYGDNASAHAGTTYEIAQDAVFSTFTSGLAQSRHATSENAADGGFVELGSTSRGFARWSGRVQSNLTGDPLSIFEKRDALDGVLRDFSDRDDFWDGSRIAVDDDLLKGEPVANPDEAVSPAQDFTRAFASDEGGMISLIAAAYPTGGSAQASIDLPRSSAEPILGVRGIGMDKAVGRFRAFDLAAAPMERLNGSGMTTETVGDRSGAERASIPSIADTRAAQQSESSGNESEEQPLHATAAIPAIAVASLLAPRGKAVGQRSVHFVANLLRWLKQKVRDDRTYY